MKRKNFSYSSFLFSLILPFLISGCATTKSTVVLDSKPAEVSKTVVEETLPKTSIETKEGDLKDQKKPVIKKGFVFAKTDFQGVVKTAYVSLFFEHLENPEIKYNIYIGDKEDLSLLNLDAKTVEPGYFLIELPEGPYKISTISIPVGTTKATEALDIRIDVVGGSTIYAGTLQVLGTKEKIKLGGVPVIKPGFDFVVNILNEKVEALAVFDEKFPNLLLKPSVALMSRPITHIQNLENLENLEKIKSLETK